MEELSTSSPSKTTEQFLQKPWRYLILSYHKKGVAHDMICHVALDDQVVHPVSSDGTVVGVVYGAVANVRSIHAPTQMEVNGVPPQPKRLAHVSNFSALNPVLAIITKQTRRPIALKNYTGQRAHIPNWSGMRAYSVDHYLPTILVSSKAFK